MKHIKYILLYALFFAFLFASTWTSDVKIALEMENNITNTGNESTAFTNYGSIPYSTGTVYSGTYSLGPINTSGQHVRSSAATSTAYKTIQFATNVTASGLPTDAEFISDQNFNIRFYVYSGVMYYSDAAHGQIGGYTIGTGAYHVWTANYNGTAADIYKDGTHMGQLTTATQPGYASVSYNIGNYEGYNTLNYCNCYMDNIVFSTVNSGGVEITPVPPTTLTSTPLPTLTFTLTSTITPTFTITPNLTATATWFTPTPHYSLTPCNPGIVAYATPMFVATMDWEGGCVLEPFTILGPDGNYRLFYTANSWGHNGYGESIAMATSPYPYGPWTRTGRVIGNGNGGISQPTAQPYAVHIGSEWRLYFGGAWSGSIEYCTSTDCTNFSYVGVALSSAAFISVGCGLALTVDNIGMQFDGTNWIGLVEVQIGACPSLGNQYALWPVKSTDGGNTFAPMSAVPAIGLNPDNSTGRLTAGSRSFQKIGSRWHDVPHIDYPTYLYHAESNDMFNWITYPTPVVTPGSSGGGLSNTNQVSDCGQGLEYQGNVFWPFDWTDNANGNGAIGYIQYHGTLAEFDSCAMPTYTFTPTNTPVATLTSTLTLTLTPTPTRTYTLTPTLTWTLTPTPTYTVTPTFTNTPILFPAGYNRSVQGYRITQSNGSFFIVWKWQSMEFVQWQIMYALKPTGITIQELR